MINFEKAEYRMLAKRMEAKKLLNLGKENGKCLCKATVF